MHDIAGILGLAKRSGNVISGEAVLKAIQSQKAQLVIIGVECGANMKKKYMDKCAYYEIPYMFLEETILNQAIGMQNRKAVAITDKGFAQKLYACLKG